MSHPIPTDAQVQEAWVFIGRTLMGVAVTALAEKLRTGHVEECRRLVLSILAHEYEELDEGTRYAMAEAELTAAAGLLRSH
ncbi:MAG: hypothetical protein JO006_09555 [Paucibacter sp.]|nr:hypothetical protein [Roseateles sp.]